MMSEKRKHDESDSLIPISTEDNSTSVVLHKKQRTDEMILMEHKSMMIPAAAGAPPRTSNLMAPNMCLTGHAVNIFYIY